MRATFVEKSGKRATAEALVDRSVDAHTAARPRSRCALGRDRLDDRLLAKLPDEPVDGVPGPSPGHSRRQSASADGRHGGPGSPAVPDANPGESRAGTAAAAFRWRLAWVVALSAALAVRLWNAFTGPLMWGYDAPGHIAYVFYLDRYGAIPWAHQGWGYFHPPLHYLMGWVLAQFGSAEVLLRGLALVGSAASLALAGFAAWATRLAVPERAGPPLFAFVAVAFVPVQLYTSPMVGNELTCAFFGAAALSSLVANERRSRPVWILSTRTGVLVALALLSKFTGAVYLAGCLGVIALRPFFDRRAGVWRESLQRAAALCIVVAVLAGPFYARNLERYGTPFRMNRDYALTGDVEALQAPGERSWRDFVAVSPRLFSDPRPAAPHLVHSVWGTAYVNAWVDLRALWNRLPEPEAERLQRIRRLLLGLGLGPTLLALLGAAAAVVDVRRRRRLAVYLPMLMIAAVSLVAFASFALRVPRISALKASYLLALSLPFGVFVARGVELAARHRGFGALAALAVVLPAVVSTAAYWNGWLQPDRPDHRSLGRVQLLVGDAQAARAFYSDRLATSPAAYWREGLAAVELESGNPERARALYRQLASEADAPSLERLAVSEALAGDPAAARRHLDRAVLAGGDAITRANRGAVAAQLGDLAQAELDLAAALAADPAFAVAAHNLSAVLLRAGREDEAAAAREVWRRAVAASPTGPPHGVGVGLLEPSLRPLLWFDGAGLGLAEAPFAAAPKPPRASATRAPADAPDPP